MYIYGEIRLDREEVLFSHGGGTVSHVKYVDASFPSAILLKGGHIPGHLRECLELGFVYTCAVHVLKCIGNNFNA